MKISILLLCISSLLSFYSFGQDSVKCNPETLRMASWKKMGFSGMNGKEKIQNSFSAVGIINHQFIDSSRSFFLRKKMYF